MQQLQARQIITDDREISVLFKLVLGFNQERGGSYVEDDYTYIRSLPEEAQAEACLQLLRQRLKNPLETLRFMLQKTDAAWFQRDGYFYWYHEGALLEFSQQMAELSEAEQEQYWRAVRGLTAHRHWICWWCVWLTGWQCWAYGLSDGALPAMLRMCYSFCLWAGRQ